jgi:hypothetical protein
MLNQGNPTWVKIRPEFGEKYIFAQNQIFAVLPEMSSRL